MKLEHSLIPYTKINSKWIKDLNIRSDILKLLEENLGRMLCDMKNCSKIFSEPPPRVLNIKTIKWDLIKLNSFCTEKETINQMKGEPTEQKKISANKETDKWLIPQQYKFLQLN